MRPTNESNSKYNILEPSKCDFSIVIFQLINISQGKPTFEYRDNRLISLHFRFHFKFDSIFELQNSEKVSKLILKKKTKNANSTSSMSQTTIS